MPNKNKGIVIYTDGSSLPNPGYIGWGAHGYMYEVKELKKTFTIDNHLITNKGYKLQQSEELIAVEPLKYFDFLGSYLEQGTNNRAEILAIFNSLQFFKKLEISNILILSDSEYAINGLTKWHHGWSKANWMKPDGSEVINAKLWQDTLKLMTEIRESGIEISIDWVKGHNDIFGNTHADALALIARNRSTDGIAKSEFKDSDVKGYWKTDNTRHPFINYSRIYFNSVATFNTPGHYYQANPGTKDDFIVGKRVPEASFSVIKLTEPEDIIESIKEKQYRIARDTNAIVLIKNDRAFNKSIYPFIQEYGGHCLLENKHNLNLNFIDKKPVTLEINPTGLSLRAIESFSFLEDILDSFTRILNNESSDADIKLHSQDITGILFDISEKTVKKEVKTIKTLKAEITNNLELLKIKHSYVKENQNLTTDIPLIMGNDILHRNNLKRLEDLNPSVFLITWDVSAKSLRYATVIKCDTGIGIWSNFFADRIFI